MPLRKVNSGYKWGDAGKTYYGEYAKMKAQAQGRAIEAGKPSKDKKKPR
jgi:hypothetical protein